MDPEDAAAFDGYSLERLGIRLAEGDRYYGLLQEWEGYPVDVRYVRVRWQRSPLYAEYTASTREHDAAIRGVHWQHNDEDRKRAWKARDLIFRGLPRGAPRGKRGPQKGSDVERWVQLGQEIGEGPARAKFKAATPTGRGEWERAYQWWWRHVRPRLQKTP